MESVFTVPTVAYYNLRADRVMNVVNRVAGCHCGKTITDNLRNTMRRSYACVQFTGMFNCFINAIVWNYLIEHDGVSQCQLAAV